MLNEIIGRWKKSKAFGLVSAARPLISDFLIKSSTHIMVPDRQGLCPLPYLYSSLSISPWTTVTYRRSSSRFNCLRYQRLENLCVAFSLLIIPSTPFNLINFKTLWLQTSPALFLSLSLHLVTDILIKDFKEKL